MSITSKVPFRSAKSAVRARQAADPAHRALEDDVPQLDMGDVIKSYQRDSLGATGQPEHSAVAITQHVNGHVTEMQNVGTILRLSNEMLLMILDHVEADPEKAITVDNRLYLSRESFCFPHPPHPDQEQTIGNFRRVCRRFSELGAVRQFARVTTRFSQKGFRRLEEIARQKHLAQCVKKFSYMVPYFYSTGTGIHPAIRRAFSI